LSAEKPERGATVVEAVDMEAVSARNPDVVLVRNCNWKVAAGDFWLVTGAHGAGKSDFMATASGLHRHNGGTLRLFGQDTSRMREADTLATRVKIGFVFKSGGRMFPDLTVAENIALPLQYHRHMTPEALAKVVGDLAELTGLGDVAKEKTRDLTSNWISRVGLARALALQPELLFLDEPLSGLEARHRRWWLDFVSRLCSGSAGLAGGGMTVIAAASDPDEWMDRAQQFALIRDRSFEVITRDQLARAEAAWVEAERTQVWLRRHKPRVEQ
jgi:phospholipid/cholesterol/gamma-HCH transport system ATP-binding protein